MVDDENLITDINQETLESLGGYQVSSFTCSEKALEAFCARPERYDLVLTDMTMPRLNGLQLAEKMIAAKPGMPIILCTGFSDLITKEKNPPFGHPEADHEAGFSEGPRIGDKKGSGQ